MSEQRLIDANALKKEIKNLAIPIWAISVVNRLIDNAPTILEDCEMKKAYGDCYHCFASAIVKRAREIRENTIPKGEVVFDKDGFEICSNCGGSVRCTSVKFCENCGARMEAIK